MSKFRSLGLVAGIDEAGRGPMIGPLVVCGISMFPDDVPKLEELGVRDSKRLTAKRRAYLATQIREIARRISLRRIPADEIDALRGSGTSLNSIEVDAFASIVDELAPTIVYMDAADVIESRFAETVAARSKVPTTKCKFVAQHRADSTYPIVSAASIVAKVTRDAEIRKYHEIYGDFGSGYPTDPKSIAFVRDLIESEVELPPIVRKSWKSIERIASQVLGRQTALGDF